MDLPTFNGQGTGPQGTGGIPPEEVRLGLQRAGQDLAGSQLGPEDTPAAQAILDHEAEGIMRSLGVMGPPPPTQSAPQGQPAAPPGTPAAAVPQATPTGGDGRIAQPAQVPGPQGTAPGQDDLSARIRSVTQKYGGDFDKLAAAYAHTDAARTQAQQDRGILERQIGELQGQVGTLTSLMEESLSGQPRLPGSPAGAPVGSETVTPEQFFADPAGHSARITERVMKEHLGSFITAQQRVEEGRSFQTWTESHAQELDRLRPIMADFYRADPQLYSALPARKATELLLDRARDRETAIIGMRTLQEIGAGPGGPGLPAAPAPQLGASLPMGGGGYATRTPTQPQNGDYSRTPGFAHLMRSRMGTVDEDRAMQEVLRERGFGEHIT